MLLKVNAISGSDELELIQFYPKTQTFKTIKINISRLIKTSEIRFVVLKKLVYILLDIDTNYFISVDLNNTREDFIEEKKLSNNIGYAPSLSLLGEEYIAAVGGLNSDTVNIFDLNNEIWIEVGKMQSTRYGAYIMYDEKDKVVYICGGLTNEQDNTLEIEYFSVKNLKNFEIKLTMFNEGFSLRRCFPVAFQLVDSKTFIVCGGCGLLNEDTNTSTIVSVSTETCELCNDLHHELSSKNPNISFYSYYVFFFVSDNEVIRFNTSDNKFYSIYRPTNEEEEEEI